MTKLNSLITFGLLISVLLVIAGFRTAIDDVSIVAHRGAMNHVPENTMEAFKLAVEQGADIVEIDLRTSADGVLYILHDDTLDRTTNGTGTASSFTLSELQALDAGSWYGEEFEGLRIPSFREVLEWSTEEDIVLLLDLKESGREFAENVSNEVLQYGKVENMVVGVRSPEQAAEFRELMPDALQLAFMRSPDLIEEFASQNVDVLRLWLRWLHTDNTLADRVHKSGKKLMINGTVGELDEAEEILSYNPHWILIDDVPQLRESMNTISEKN